jgi:hypothetical protein
VRLRSHVIHLFGSLDANAFRTFDWDDASAGRGPKTVSRAGRPGGAMRTVRASDIADWQTDFHC